MRVWNRYTQFEHPLECPKCTFVGVDIVTEAQDLRGCLEVHTCATNLLGLAQATGATQSFDPPPQFEEAGWPNAAKTPTNKLKDIPTAFLDLLNNVEASEAERRLRRRSPLTRPSHLNVKEVSSKYL